MERVHQRVSDDGLEIPLPLIQRYGLQPGAEVVLEFDVGSIRVRPAIATRQEIENKALRHLLRYLGDAVTVTVQRQDEAWSVTVYAATWPESIGELVYELTGDFIHEQSTPLETMRRRAGGDSEG